jgi:hypothetical protein
MYYFPSNSNGQPIKLFLSIFQRMAKKTTSILDFTMMGRGRSLNPAIPPGISICALGKGMRTITRKTPPEKAWACARG